MVLLKTATNTEENAKAIIRHLIDNKFVACCQLYKVNSTYWWKEEKVNEDEFVVECRCGNEDMFNVMEEIKKIHTYELPEIIATPMLTTDNYDKWCVEKDKYKGQDDVNKSSV